MNHLKYFESIIRGETFDDEDINMVEDLLAELDDLGLDTILWGNRHNIFLKKLSQIDIEIYYQSKKDIEYDSNEIYDIVHSRLNKIENYLISKGWEVADKSEDWEFISMKFDR